VQHYSKAIVVAAFLLIKAARGGEADDLAKRILKAADRPVALVHLPRCDDEALAVKLAEAASWTCVHAQDADAATVLRARKLADAAALLNRRVAIDQGDLNRLLPVARSCDLVVLTNLADKECTETLAGEIARVLHPWYGLAVVGFKGPINEKSRTWAQRIGKVAESPELPGMLLVQAAPLAGADDWTHWWHGPDNNAVSEDRAFAIPETVRWTGKPFFSTRVELPIIANGRLFMLWNGHLLDRSRGKFEVQWRVKREDGDTAFDPAVARGCRRTRICIHGRRPGRGVWTEGRPADLEREDGHHSPRSDQF